MSYEAENNFWPNPFNLLSCCLDRIARDSSKKSAKEEDFESEKLQDAEHTENVEVFLNSSVQITTGYLLKDTGIAFVYDVSTKNNIFMILAKMNTLLVNNEDVKSVLSEYFDDNNAVLYKQSENNQNATPFHVMCKYGNIEMLKICIRWLKEAPKDGNGKTALEYSIKRLTISEFRDSENREEIREEIGVFIVELYSAFKNLGPTTSIC